MNSLLYNLFYFVNGFPYAFIESNSSQCIILILGTRFSEQSPIDHTAKYITSSTP